jgi:tetratricopeptide (TPR) repeat protein
MAEWRAKLHVGRVTIAGLMTVVLGVLIIGAWKQTAYWKDSETLWNHTLVCTTRNDTARNNLGQVLLQKGNTDEAITQYQEALQIKPDDAEAHNSLGNALRQEGKLDDAIIHFQKAVQIKPDYAEAHSNLGNALCQKGKLDEGISHFEQALQTQPGFAAAHYNLGIALLQKGSVSEAITHFQKALQIAPANPRIQNKLAWLLATCPDASLRNGNKAVELAQQANALTGGKDPIVLHTLAAALAEAGRFTDAKESVQKAIELAQAAGQQSLVKQLNGELQRYEAGLPLHQ